MIAVFLFCCAALTLANGSPASNIAQLPQVPLPDGVPAPPMGLSRVVRAAPSGLAARPENYNEAAAAADMLGMRYRREARGTGGSMPTKTG